MKKIAMIFPGQGSQTIGMGRDFYENSAVAKEMIENASKRLGVDFKEILFEENEKLDSTQYTQPAILLVSMIAYELLKEKTDLKPELFLGHSLGEFSALCATGAISYLDAVELVHTRGKLMNEACSQIEAGMMALVGIEDKVAEDICSNARKDGKKVWPANYNQDGQLVIAGIKEDLSSLEQTFKDAGAKRAILLNMSVSSHCPLLSSAQEPLEESLTEFIIDNFDAPIISNVTTQPYSTKDEALTLLKKQLVEPVRYKQSILAISSSIDLAIEFGNGVVLKGLNRRIAKDLKTINISDMATLQKAIEELS